MILHILLGIRHGPNTSIVSDTGRVRIHIPDQELVIANDLVTVLLTKLIICSVVDPDPDPVGSGIICRIPDPDPELINSDPDPAWRTKMI